ncbi:hypothetical protein FB451DRAFT_1439281 [Mycena latifolia]|nr:hypothetical protein FB451DRAFT_1439281 [Mycena latifolia]
MPYSSISGHWCQSSLQLEVLTTPSSSVQREPLKQHQDDRRDLRERENTGTAENKQENKSNGGEIEKVQLREGSSVYIQLQLLIAQTDQVDPGLIPPGIAMALKVTSSYVRPQFQSAALGDSNFTGLLLKEVISGTFNHPRELSIGAPDTWVTVALSEENPARPSRALPGARHRLPHRISTHEKLLRARHWDRRTASALILELARRIQSMVNRDAMISEDEGVDRPMSTVMKSSFCALHAVALNEARLGPAFPR